MTAFRRSTHWLGSAMCLVLACCASTPESSGFRIVDVFRSDKSDEERAWHALLERSDVRQVGSDRLIVEAWGAMGTSMEIVELRMLARAGAAADRLGKSHFAIVHIRDRNQPVSNGLFSDSIFGADEVWIGTYEALVRSRYERDYGFATRQWLGPALSAVIVALDQDHLGQKEAFEALNMYHTLNRNQLVR